MDKLVYTRDELMADHPYAKGHREVGYLLHCLITEDVRKVQLVLEAHPPQA